MFENEGWGKTFLRRSTATEVALESCSLMIPSTGHAAEDAFDRMDKGKVKFRFVIDMASLTQYIA